MSLSNALSNAVSGLVAASRGTEVVASNLANALTPGFARREMVTSPRPHISAGGGVHVDGVVRVVRTSVLSQTRLASAETARSAALADFHKGMAEALGVPGQPGTLSTLMADFDAALVTAAARADSETNLSRVLLTAQDLGRAFNDIGTKIQTQRTTADRAIASDIRALNDNLVRVSELNRQITVQMASGEDATALQDLRQSVIDAIAQIVPVREIPRESGNIALFTTSGTVLLDGSRPPRFEFQEAGPIVPQMQAGTAALGFVKIDGVEMAANQMSMLAGGRLEANFMIRDSDAPAAQARLDAAARDLYDRFADPELDATLAAGAAGLFTDGGGAIAAGADVGLAQRIAVNSAVDPARGGALWKLREGLDAAAPGAVGRSDLLEGMRQALLAGRLPVAPGISPVSRTAAAMVADVTSTASVLRITAETKQSAAASRGNAFEAMMRQDGVDSDKEMETLLSLERAYASNAKVLKAVDEMIQTILRLT